MIMKMKHNENKLANIDTMLENLKKEEGYIKHKLERHESKFNKINGRKRYKNCWIRGLPSSD